jgi:hypothetical protein
MSMEVGKPKRIYTVEPIESPVPQDETERKDDREDVPAPGEPVQEQHAPPT